MLIIVSICSDPQNNMSNKIKIVFIIYKKIKHACANFGETVVFLRCFFQSTNFYATVSGDKTLVQSLVLDALVTDGFDKREPPRVHKEENEK